MEKHNTKQQIGSTIWGWRNKWIVQCDDTPHSEAKEEGKEVGAEKERIDSIVLARTKAHERNKTIF